jgi:hypothetical protein
MDAPTKVCRKSCGIWRRGRSCKSSWLDSAPSNLDLGVGLPARGFDAAISLGCADPASSDPAFSQSSLRIFSVVPIM